VVSPAVEGPVPVSELSKGLLLDFFIESETGTSYGQVDGSSHIELTFDLAGGKRLLKP